MSHSVPLQHQMQNVDLYRKATASIQTLKNSKETVGSVWKEVFSIWEESFSLWQIPSSSKLQFYSSS